MIEVQTRCTVYGPAEAVARFRAFAFTPAEGAHAIMRFDRVVTPPPIIEQAPSAHTLAMGAALVALRDRRPLRCDDTVVLIDYAGVPESVEEFWPDWRGPKLLGLRNHPVYFNMHHFRVSVGMMDEPASEVAAAYLRKMPVYEEWFEQGEKARLETGYRTLKHWRLAHWGCEGFGYPVWYTMEEPFEFTAETRDYFPEPIFRQLAQLFSELSFDCAAYGQRDAFAGLGYFNPPPGKLAFALCEPTSAIHKRVYGRRIAASAAARGQPTCGGRLSPAECKSLPMRMMGSPVRSDSSRLVT